MECFNNATSCGSERCGCRNEGKGAGGAGAGGSDKSEIRTNRGKMLIETGRYTRVVRLH